MTYVSKTTPRAHQKKALELTRGKRLFAYLCEMGTGKTKMVLDEWGERVMDKTIHDLFVIAPAGSYHNWENELLKHLPPELFKCVRSFVWISGMGKGAQQNLEAFLAIRKWPRVFIMNVEALSSAEGARDAAAAFIDVAGRRSMMVVDESTTIKNDSAIRTKEIMELKETANLRRIMTGLITPKSPLDLYSQFEFLDWRILGHASIFTFKRRYCIIEKTHLLIGLNKKGKPKYRNFDQIVGYRNLEELQQLIAPYSYRVLKKDCLDLPPKIYQRREVQLTEEQKRVYNDLILFSTAELDSKANVTTNMIITKLLRLHQIVCGHSVDDDDKTVHDIKSNRISSMMELLEEHSGKVIIWSNYLREIDKIVETLETEYGKGSVAQFHGGNKPSRSREEANFLSNSSACRFMVATQSAGGRGNTWVNANLVIYFSNSYDLELRMQSEDRSHRDGLKHAVTYVDLVAPRTVDEKILLTLRKKLNMATLITGENYREWLI